jgi:DNA processing protein
LLVSNGVTVVSGLAHGVDTIAHTTAIERGGRTIAVLGNPLQKFYPAKNRELQKRIMKDHLAISQFPPGTVTQKFHYPQRNKLMALISHGTIIIEAGATSGTQSQAWEALRLKRPLFVMQSLAESGLEWVQRVIDYGACVVREESDLLDMLPLEVNLDAAVAF